MTKIIIGIGIPGSGKTTALKALADKYGYKYVCPDDIRQELTGDPMDQSKNREVWAEAHRRTEEFLADKKTVVFDATFANPDQRKSFLKFAREHGAEKIQGIYADIALEVAKERNLKRERKVPEHVLNRMQESLEKAKPDVSEGFDALFTINEYQKLAEAEKLKEGERIKKEFKKIR